MEKATQKTIDPISSLYPVKTAEEEAQDDRDVAFFHWLLNHLYDKEVNMMKRGI